MGGFGSGRREYARTPTVEECRHLEANRLVDVTTASSVTRRVTWGDSDDPSATIGVRPEGVADDLPDDVDETRAARLPPHLYDDVDAARVRSALYDRLEVRAEFVDGDGRRVVGELVDALE